MKSKQQQQWQQWRDQDGCCIYIWCAPQNSSLCPAVEMPYFYIFLYACHHGNKISAGYFGGRNSRMSLFILPYWQGYKNALRILKNCCCPLVKFHIFCQKREYLSVLEACLCCYVTVDTKHIRHLLRTPILQV